MRYFSFTLLIGLALTTAGCPQKQQKIDAQTVVVALEGAPANLDPRFSIDAYSSRIIDAVLRRLVMIDANGQPQPDLLISWEFISPQQLKLVLKQDQAFHDGTLITPEVIAKNLAFHQNPESGSPYSGSLNQIESVKISGQEILLNLKEAFAPILVSLAIPIVHPDQLELERIEVPIGSGPYELEGAMKQDQLVLVAHSKDLAVQKILFRTISDPNNRVLALESGQVDLAQNNIPAKDLERLASKEFLTIDHFSGWNVSYLGFQLEHPILQNAKVRKAIRLAIDRETILRTLLKNTAQKTNTLLPFDHWAHINPQPSSEALRVEYAKYLLDQAGYQDPDADGPQTRFVLSYKTSTNPERVLIAQAIAADLKKVGIGVKVQTAEFGTFFQDIRTGNFEMYSLTWVGVIEPDLYHYALHSESIPPNGANRGHLKDPSLDKMLDAARKATDQAERKRLYALIQNYLDEQLPVIPLWANETIVVRNKRLTGFVPVPSGGYRVFEHAKLTP